MIVKLVRHRTIDGIVEAHTPPDLNRLMGRFQPARWQPQHRCYWVGAEHVDSLVRLLTHERIRVVDERNGPTAATPAPPAYEQTRWDPAPPNDAFREARARAAALRREVTS